MKTKTVITKQGYQFRIDAQEVAPTVPEYRMEFYVDSPIQKCLILSLTHQAALLLAAEDPGFNPIDWLWDKGCEMIQGAAEINRLENGDFVIFERHVKLKNQLSIDQLEKRA
ncbi:hypothetical protein [Mesobacillus stamsii]|uniref:Uncharacterized protein n=1 Tax=Mesobacillus stamsii TaxID=225347 RepID=A0ABU0G257_9BACI|nr:hypothetical protein [Mesobacillus stamsii]MDQ0415659.1 hypothetical protein [Mesobacillus stamsii]